LEKLFLQKVAKGRVWHWQGIVCLPNPQNDGLEIQKKG
jgi:hypothetical protein